MGGLDSLVELGQGEWCCVDCKQPGSYFYISNMSNAGAYLHMSNAGAYLHNLGASLTCYNVEARC